MIRITRMARILRSVPELVVLLKGIGAASRSVCVFFLLWLIIIYIFAVVFRQITQGSDLEEAYFSSVPAGMNTLLLEAILPDNAALINMAGANNMLFWFL